MPTAPELLLLHFPGACSRVSLCALVATGLPHRVELVDLARGAQAEPAFRARSPLGKVPALLVAGEPLLETAAILTFLDALAPEAGLFPPAATPLAYAERAGGLSFCGGTLHPIVRGLANPQRLTTGDGGPVRERARKLAEKAFAYADVRLSERGWWLGERSIVDAYLDWAVDVARRAGFDLAAFPRLDGLPRRLSDMAAYRAMVEAERQHRAELAR